MLYIVPTPIGNLEDITFRAVRVLKEVDMILAEDTRTTHKLLSHYNIESPLRSYHKFNEHNVCGSIIEQLLLGRTMALVSDAGTPGISDPGFLLVRECISRGITIQCLPGPTAFVPALIVSGAPLDKFTFIGFLPAQKGRKSKLESLASITDTFVLYESPMRLVKTLDQLTQYVGKDRIACVCREITKIHEETRCDSLHNLYQYYCQHPVKGEIVIVVYAQK